MSSPGTSSSSTPPRSAGGSRRRSQIRRRAWPSCGGCSACSSKDSKTGTDPICLNGERLANEKNGVRPQLGGAGEAAVDDDDFAGDEAVALDEAHHGLGDVVGGDDALERRRLGALAHQVVLLVLEHAL